MNFHEDLAEKCETECVEGYLQMTRLSIIFYSISNFQLIRSVGSEVRKFPINFAMQFEFFRP